MQRQMMRHIRRVHRILIRHQRKRIPQRPLRTLSLIMRELRRNRLPEINSLLKEPIIIIVHRAIGRTSSVAAAAVGVHLIEPPILLVRVVELHVLVHHVVVGVVFVMAVCAAGGGAGADLGAAVDHLDEFAALEAEVDVLVVFEHFGVVGFGELERAVHVAVEDGVADFWDGG